MGSDFSLPLLPATPALPARPRRRRTRRTPPVLPYTADADTVANTLANRSPTPVARHVALARLAERLSSLRRSRRHRVIEQLHIPSHVLREVRRYTPGHSFESLDEVEQQESEDADSEDDDEDDDAANELDSELGSPRAQETSGAKQRKGVSFAKYAEMRLFRE